MSIVLAIIAVVMGSGLAMFSASLDRRQLQETNTKLAALRNAILNYRIIYNRLPCPADLTLAYASNYFGVEAPNTNGVTNNCTTGASYHIGTGVRGAPGRYPRRTFLTRQSTILWSEWCPLERWGFQTIMPSMAGGGTLCMQSTCDLRSRTHLRP